MELNVWKDIHSKDSFEELINIILSNEIYWLKGDAVKYGEARMAHSTDENYYHNEMYYHIERIDWIRERLLELYAPAE